MRWAFDHQLLSEGILSHRFVFLRCVMSDEQEHGSQGVRKTVNLGTESMERAQVEFELKSAASEKRAPTLSSKQMIAKDLSGLDFTSDYFTELGQFSANLMRADLRKACLRGSNLTKVDLAAANLRAADIRDARLSGANLFSALLQSTDLRGADLRGANLVSAEMQMTNVEGADFEGARFGATAVGGVDLSGALNLDLALHIHASSISSESLRMTAAGLSNKTEPERRSVLRFLSNSGVDDQILMVVRSWIGMPIEFHSVFLSHSSLDKAFARKLYGDLRSVGVKCWFDERQILPGDNILDLVDQGIKVWDKLLLVCSTNSLSQKTGWWVEQEIERSLAKERELRKAGGLGSTLIPITIDNYVFEEWNSRFKASIVDKHVGDFRSWHTPAEYAIAFDRLRNALDENRC
jgi:uncharacterized protein YjbI with pentapeptide repeats